KSVSSSSNVPGDEIFWANGIRRLVGGPENPISGYTLGIDEDYIKSFGLEVIAGRSFDKDHTNDRKSVILNRAMVEALEFKDPSSALGEKVIHGDTVDGVAVR